MIHASSASTTESSSGMEDPELLTLPMSTRVGLCAVATPSCVQVGQHQRVVEACVGHGEPAIRTIIRSLCKTGRRTNHLPPNKIAPGTTLSGADSREQDPTSRATFGSKRVISEAHPRFLGLPFSLEDHHPYATRTYEHNDDDIHGH